MRRGVVAALLACATLLLAACEKPDFSGVQFKPTIVDPGAHKTSFRAYLFARRPQKIVWGNEFLFHNRSIAEQEFSPISGAEILFDEAVRLKTDDTGLVAQAPISEGLHTLRYRAGDDEYATWFRAKKEHVSLVVMEAEDEGKLFSASTLAPHTFLTVPHFKRLLGFHEGVRRVLTVYEDALGGRSLEKWERLLSDDYHDGYGGKTDFLRALRVRSAPRPKIEVVDAKSELAEEAGTVIVRLERDGRPDFVRLELKATQRGAWRISQLLE